jgi:hypothetical protein
MNKKIKSINIFYKQLGVKTQLIIKISLIIYISLLIVVLLSHFAIGLPQKYELLLISEDLINASKSIAIIGLLGTIIFHNIEKGMAEK